MAAHVRVREVSARRGARRLALEGPSSGDDARVPAGVAGLDVVGIPVGPDGVQVDALDRADADALVLTPSHRWPTGGVLSAAARAEVIGWARRRFGHVGGVFDHGCLSLSVRCLEFGLP
ncbi:hypothetical protein [Nonomuraea sp. JJY05]|uniref:hypothetical protein n=1 Tax=Nonomuraea sp. JJY05 TaxID=3350255 RepID=UPI00373E60E2